MLSPYMRCAWLILAVSLLPSCGAKKEFDPAVAAPVETLPSIRSENVSSIYKVGVFDVLSFRVFREPDLTNEALEVDAAGYIYLPLIGEVQAAGKTVRELTDEIATRLDERYIVNPQVTISVAESFGNRITVDGQVEKPGVYPIKGNTSLLQVIAMSEGTTEFAKTDEVLIFRIIGDTPSVARFDVGAIRTGDAEDPAMKGGDVVVVGYSSARRFWKDGLAIFPSIAGVFISLIANN
jgi:polysaccharide export outer membrane protein